MKRYVVDVTPRALASALDAYAWIALHSHFAAESWAAGLWATVDTLQTLAERGARCGDGGLIKEDLREIFYGRGRNAYRIIYRIDGDVVHVLEIRHGARTPLGADEF
ncbi:MAG: type II toxin-antitoxin system RelE/ParE family toxin [Candidatus Methylomirabilis sp.]|nr:type II toxin-antitoxin system RelE/ParE family toxin [Deltaproteobacteria bacterium]